MARIAVDVRRRIGTINPLIYGSFLEQIGRCIYGGVVDAIAAAEGRCVPREDTLAAVRTLAPPILRWPGGNIASAYHWLDGVGPSAQRPRRLNLASGGEEPNLFGTAEFIAYCRLVGAEPYLCLNLGTGDIDEAAAWVEYCNGTGNTAWANLRRAHGHEAPFGVRYWGLGNEPYGAWQIGAKTAEAYLSLAREVGKVVRRVDPSVRLIGCGLDGLSGWDLKVLAGLGGAVDYHSVHLYTGHPDYYQNVLMPHQAERGLRVAGALTEQASYGKGIPPRPIAFDEWGVLHHEMDPLTGLEEPYDLADALAVATYFNIFHRHCRTVTMACQAILVNAIAPIVTTATGLYYNTIYWPSLLYRRHCQGTALAVWVEAPTHTLPPLPTDPPPPLPHRVADLGPFPYLDVSATVDERGERLTLAVINRHREEALEAGIEVAGTTVMPGGRWYGLADTDVRAGNSAAMPERVGLREGELAGGSSFIHRFPPHSLTFLTLRCVKAAEVRSGLGVGNEEG